MKSIWQKILRVDLEKGLCSAESVPERVYEYFMGGAGLVAYFLWKECPAGTKAFDPANRLIFATGPLQGLRQTGAAKWTGGGISPSINMNFASAATAAFGIEIKKAGYDALVIHGKATKPVYLVVDDDRAELVDASGLWGKDGFDAHDAIAQTHGKQFETASIGQAGERLVRFANIGIAKKSFLGRGGLGSVMGSKHLKAVAVRGSRKCPVHDAELLNSINRELNKRIADIDAAKPYNVKISAHGTSIATQLFAPQGNLPIKNYTLGEFPSGVANLGAPNYAKVLNAKPWPCRYCTLMCHNKTEVKEGPYAYKGKGPEYESFAMLGFDLMIDDMEAVAYAGHLCNLYSMDTISTGGVLAWAFESYEKGILTKEDTYGLELTWGNAAAMVEMVKKIALREDGLARLLGEGSRIASETVGKGSQDWAVQMKGQEIAAHDWRATYISALNYATGCASGPNHEQASTQHIWVAHKYIPEWGLDHVEEEERYTWHKAAERQSMYHDYCNILNSLVHCKFQEFSGFTLADSLNSLNAASGMGWTQEDLQKIGERITNLQKLLNIRCGWKKADDFAYPKRFMEPKPDGKVAGKVPTGLDQVIEEYYRYRGWDENGIPTPGKLKELGLDDIPGSE
jgi:aldehyde:ferredoxin oxidoreductase